jgi:hypothetical protein
LDYCRQQESKQADNDGSPPITSYPNP